MLRIAEVIDAYRVFPRIVLLSFMISVGVIMSWYLSFEDKPVVECNDTLMLGLLEKGHTLVAAEKVACRQVGVIDRPLGYTTLVSVFIGASAAVFGFYAGTGRKWNESKSNSSGNNSSNGRSDIPPI